MASFKDGGSRTDISAIRLRPEQHLPKSHKRGAVCTSRCEGTQLRQKLWRPHNMRANAQNMAAIRRRHLEGGE